MTTPPEKKELSYNNEEKPNGGIREFFLILLAGVCIAATLIWILGMVPYG